MPEPAAAEEGAEAEAEAAPRGRGRGGPDHRSDNFFSSRSIRDGCCRDQPAWVWVCESGISSRL